MTELEVAIRAYAGELKSTVEEFEAATLKPATDSYSQGYNRALSHVHGRLFALLIRYGEGPTP